MNSIKFKEDVEKLSLINGPYIVLCDDDFLVYHYINYIKYNANNYKMFESFSDYKKSKFIDSQFNYITILVLENLDSFDESFIIEKSLLIFSKKISKEIKETYKDNIVSLDKLEEWQLKDYVFSICSGIDENYLNKFFSCYKNNKYEIEKQINKVKCFSKEEKEKLSYTFINNNTFNVYSEYMIFTIINSLITKDNCYVLNSFNKLKLEDPVGLLHLCFKTVKNIVKVIGSKNPTQEHTGLSSKQIYVINKQFGLLSLKRLIYILDELANLELKIKCGFLDTKFLLDYILILFFKE